MMPVRVAENFSDFFKGEFLRNAQDPCDVLIPQGRKMLGDLKADEHLIYAPSPLIGGTEDLSNIQKMPAWWAMVCNSDIACQLDEGPVAGVMAKVTSVLDDNGLRRVRLKWS
ncbi:hypothetical protein [Rhizobium sp.]|uniref:hypothetical protein n=1 Tax=Rhizobium sp. TaxID=391 RepID=UPI00289DC44D